MATEMAAVVSTKGASAGVGSGASVKEIKAKPEHANNAAQVNPAPKKGRDDKENDAKALREREALLEEEDRRTKVVEFVVGIDIGTAESGYAYAERDKPEQIMMRQAAGAKELTAVLLDHEGKFLQYGLEAKKAYIELTSENQQTCYYLEMFKMALYKHKTNARPMLKEVGGKEISAITVMGAVLAHFKRKAQVQMRDGFPSKVPPRLRVTYVVTVPAIWDDGAKQVMREAAVLADMPQAIIMSVSMGSGAAKNNVDGKVGSSESKDKKGDHKDKDPYFTVALESEAASLTCYDILRKDILHKNNEKTAKRFSWMVGMVYMVADVGGGTSDITVNKVTKDQTLGQVLPSSGGAVGSQYVDLAIITEFIALFGKSVMEEMRSVHQTAFLDLMSDISMVKTSVKADFANRSLRIPAVMIRLLGEEARKVNMTTDAYILSRCTQYNESKQNRLPTKATTVTAIRAGAVSALVSGDENEWDLVGADAGAPNAEPAPNGQPSDNKTDTKAVPAQEVPEKNMVANWVTYREETCNLLLRKPFLEFVFADVVAKNITIMEKVLKATPLSFLFLVGGFAKSEVLQAAVRQLLTNYPKTRLVIPARADQAVLVGAVRYGLNPRIISSRIMRYNYGVAVVNPFTEKHRTDGRTPEMYDKTVNGVRKQVPMCTSVFECIAEKGSEVAWNEVRDTRLGVVRDGQKEMTVAIYRSDKAINYIDDPSCEFVGCVNVSMPDLTGGLSRRVYVEFIFGSTDIAVTAYDPKLKPFKTSVSFLDNE